MTKTDIFPHSPGIVVTAATLKAVMDNALCDSENAGEIGKHWAEYSHLKAETDAEARVFTAYGVVYGYTLELLDEFLKQSNGQAVTVRINSPGGDYTAGIAMANRLTEYKGHVHTVVDGMAASAAGILFLAGDRREMKDGSLLMLHNVWVIRAGNQYDMAKTCEMLKEIDAAMIVFLAGRLSIGKEKIKVLLKDEKFMSRESADKIGAIAASDSDKKIVSTEQQREEAARKVSDTVNSAIRARLGMGGSL